MAGLLKNRRLMKSEKGSVMMEYLILNLIFITVCAAAGGILFGDAFFFPGNARNGNYGIIGNSFIRHYNMVLNIVSMPYP